MQSKMKGYLDQQLKTKIKKNVFIKSFVLQNNPNHFDGSKSV